MSRVYEKASYTINRDGTIYAHKINRNLTPTPDAKGYLRTRMHRKPVKVHRIVAEKFIPNPHNKPQVGHINGTKTDNRVENLVWCTNEENASHGMTLGEYNNRNRTKLSIDDASELCEQYATGLFTQQELADGYGIARSYVSNITRRVA